MGTTEHETLIQLIETVAHQIEVLEKQRAEERTRYLQLAITRTKIDIAIRDAILQIERGFINQPSVDKRDTMRILGFTFQGRDETPEPLEEIA